MTIKAKNIKRKVVKEADLSSWSHDGRGSTENTFSNKNAWKRQI